MSVVTRPALHGEDRVLLHDVPWETYVALRDLEANNHVRMTYDRGELELMSPSQTHEGLAHLIGRMIDEWTVAFDIPMMGCRCMTIRREDLERGLEPDNCYYVEHELQIRELLRDKRELDLRVDPPPDLAIEVEVSRNILNKMAVYAGLGVPELWRCDGEKLYFYELDEAGEYVERERSPRFPRLPPEDVMRFLNRRHEMSETELIKTFRRWVEESVRQ